MRDVFRSVWDEPRAADPPRRVWRDWALVGGLVGVAVLEGLVRPDLPHRVLWVVVVAALAPTLLWRRQRPLIAIVAAFGVTSLVPVVVGGGQPDLFAQGFFLVLPYALYRWGSGRDILLGSAILLVSTVGSMATGDLTPGDLIGGTAVLAATVTLGLAVRARTAARDRELQQVRLLERERLARDLHDTVAHHVSAMAVRAQAGLARSTVSPDAATDALRVIEAEASRTLVEMRSIVRVLRREEPPDLGPSPGIGDLVDLADPGGAGPAVTVAVRGRVGDVTEQVGAAVYRLAQEAVTNALRHARHATRIDVRVDRDATAVRLRVHDDGDGAESRASAAPGYGIAGMVERAGLLGGTCTAGPDPDGGWTVTAVLPRRGAAT